MHVLTLKKGVFGFQIPEGSWIEPETEYLCTNAFAGAMLSTRASVAGMTSIEMPILNQQVEVKPWHGNFCSLDYAQHIYLLRGGGYGDILMLTPTVKALKQKYPHAKIHLVTGQRYFGLMNGLDVIEETLPLDLSKVDPLASRIIVYEEWIEGHEDAKSTHMAKHFASAAKVHLEDYKPFYQVTNLEREWAADNFPRTRNKRIAVQYMASCFARSYRQMMTVIVALASNPDIEVLIFGAPNQFELPEGCPEGIINMTKRCSTFRESAAVVAMSDLVIAPDSAFTHLASALDIPCIGLYGPFPAKLRISGEHAEGLQGTAKCSPCFYHASRPDSFPAGMPCAEKGFCVAMENIQPSVVVDAALKVVSPLLTAGVL